MSKTLGAVLNLCVFVRAFACVGGGGGSGEGGIVPVMREAQPSARRSPPLKQKPEKPSVNLQLVMVHPQVPSSVPSQLLLRRKDASTPARRRYYRCRYHRRHHHPSSQKERRRPLIPAASIYRVKMVMLRGTLQPEPHERHFQLTQRRSSHPRRVWRPGAVPHCGRS
jgi:hypothetical protein